MLQLRTWASLIAIASLVAACDDDGSTADDVGDQGVDAVGDQGVDTVGDQGVDTAGDAEETGPTCRTYATESSLSSGFLSGTVTTSFDPQRLELTSTITGTLTEGGPVSMTSVFAYDSLDDFVDEAATVGRVLHSRLTISGDFSNATETYEYDADGRLIGVTVVDDSPDGRDQSKTYVEWDSLGRPTSGIANIEGVDCTDIPITIEYDDVARRRTTRLVLPDGEGDCASLETRVSWEVYDEYGNVVEQVVNGTETDQDVLTYTVEATEQVCQ